jgi:lipid-binding SYLF domain-containing protein
MTMRVRAALAALAIFVSMGVVRSFAQQPANSSEEAKRLRDSVTVFTEIMGAQDKAIPGEILRKAEGVAIFPGTLKGGIIVGGLRGRGILSARTGNGWSSPAFLTMTGGSIGLQIGGQAADIVLVIMNQRGVDNLVSNQFKIGADAAAAAGPIGRDAQAATDIQMRAQILSYSRARGLFAGITVNGSTIRQDQDANQRFYGTRFDTRQIVFGTTAGSPDPVGEWVAALNKYAAR